MNRTSGLRDLLPSPRFLLNSCPLGDSQHISLLFCMSIHWFHELLGYSPSYMKDFPSISLWGSSLKLNILYVPLENTKNSGIYQVFKIFFLKLWNDSPLSTDYAHDWWLITNWLLGFVRIRNGHIYLTHDLKFMSPPNFQHHMNHIYQNKWEH